MLLYRSLCCGTTSTSLAKVLFISVGEVIDLSLLKGVGKLTGAGLQAHIIRVSLQTFFLFLNYRCEGTCEREPFVLLRSAGHVERACCGFKYGIIRCVLPSHHNQIFVRLLGRHH